MKTKYETLFVLILLATALVGAGSRHAYAGEDDDKGGGGAGEHGDGGGDHGGGDDGDDHDGNSGGGGSKGSNFSSDKSNDSDKVQNAVNQGKAVSLDKLLKFVDANYDGTVINVELKKDGPQLVYQVKLLTADNKLKTLKLDALKLTTPETVSLY